jgi:hypothetical protein|tara:strand:- start:20 stop:259 length:240 start_codon:yes stop_codon:yes gene_type:complete
MDVKVIWDDIGLEKQEFAHIYGTSRRDWPLSYWLGRDYGEILDDSIGSNISVSSIKYRNFAALSGFNSADSCAYGRGRN